MKKKFNRSRKYTDEKKNKKKKKMIINEIKSKNGEIIK